MQILSSLNARARLGHRTISHAKLKDICAFAAVITSVALVGGITSANAPLVGTSVQDIFKLEKDRSAPIDYGSGPGSPIRSPQPNLVLGKTPAKPQSAPALSTTAGTMAAASSIPSGGGTNDAGFFAPPVAWPVIPIQMSLLPDGRVISYGTDGLGTQGTKTIYFDIWDPTVGTGSNAHTTFTNTTPNQVDIFCGGASVLPNGQLLVVGGDQTINGVRNYGSNLVNIFTPSTNTMAASQAMSYARWYPSIITLTNGDKLVLGGLDQNLNPVATPEVYSATTGWRKLTNAAISTANWYYPRGFLGFDGAIYILQNDGKIMRLDASANNGLGSMTDTGARIAPGENDLPVVLMQSLKAFAVRSNQIVQTVQFTQNPPIVATLPTLGTTRYWGNTTVLPDGWIFTSGGSGVVNQLTNVQYQSQVYIWQSNAWRADSTAQNPRLYHSTSLLLPDGSVVTGGGGSPGPVREINVEIYYPHYLYRHDGSGLPATRPTLVSAPSTLTPGQSFSVTVGANDKIWYANLMRIGSITHSFDSEQRRIPLPIVQNGTTVTLDMSSVTPQKMPPGYYMIFVFNTANVPAIAKIASVPSVVQ